MHKKSHILMVNIYMSKKCLEKSLLWFKWKAKGKKGTHHERILTIEMYILFSLNNSLYYNRIF